jgi:hypothetical protein
VFHRIFNTEWFKEYSFVGLITSDSMMNIVLQMIHYFALSNNWKTKKNIKIEKRIKRLLTNTFLTSTYLLHNLVWEQFRKWNKINKIAANRCSFMFESICEYDLIQELICSHELLLIFFNASSKSRFKCVWQYF